MLELEQLHFNMCQQSWRESIGTRIAHECEDVKLDLQLDKRVDKKTFKRGREAAKWAAKLMLQERPPELLEERDWIEQRAVVDAANQKGAQLSYYDHLPVDDWMPPTEQGQKQYI